MDMRACFYPPPGGRPNKVLYGDFPPRGQQTVTLLYTAFKQEGTPFVPRIVTTAPLVYPERCSLASCSVNDVIIRVRFVYCMTLGSVQDFPCLECVAVKLKQNFKIATLSRQFE